MKAFMNLQDFHEFQIFYVNAHTKDLHINQLIPCLKNTVFCIVDIWLIPEGNYSLRLTGPSSEHTELSTYSLWAFTCRSTLGVAGG